MISDQTKIWEISNYLNVSIEVQTQTLEPKFGNKKWTKNNGFSTKPTNFEFENAKKL